MRFAGQVVVITGAASGIGLAAAQAFAAEGAQLVLTDRSADALAAARASVAQADGEPLGLAGDVSDPVRVRQQVEDVLERFGRIDVLVNSAGVIRPGPSVDVTVEDWRLVLSVNLDGTFYWSQAVAARSMIPRRAGAIVNVASIGGLTGFPEAASYVASKHAVVGLTKALAVDWAQYDVRVNAICPGMTSSSLSRAVHADDPEQQAARIARIPLNRAATAQEQASVILFLASSEASHVHGAIVNVDGGQVALSSGHAAPRD